MENTWAGKISKSFESILVTEIVGQEFIFNISNLLHCLSKIKYSKWKSLEIERSSPLEIGEGTFFSEFSVSREPWQLLMKNNNVDLGGFLKTILFNNCFSLVHFRARCECLSFLVVTNHCLTLAKLGQILIQSD